ncbi:hypothetical protein [Legionella fallonii]|uniref:Uncharacterized protein n=1 Tax=Legionella fallonii LLAP-10 TaxID=1212491 RepID=A0A098G2Q0_9GAMM|nr:hypothetical protein [Legionella fallonii]CEG55765.1 protein of unknown function [F-BOX/LEUCINE RICH REPEAT PROTEIN] [Legionella fallonii LLAP-10]
MTSTINILQELDLCYEKNQLPVIESSVEPNGGALNVEKALSDNPECWETIKIGAAHPEKKTIVLNYNGSDEPDGLYLKKRIVSKLIDDGFIMYYPTADGLQPITESTDIDAIFPCVMPVLPAQESDVVKKLNTSRERVDFLDESRLSQLSSKILESPDVYFHFVNFLFLEDLNALYQEMGYSEAINTEDKSGIEWDFASSENEREVDDWSKQREKFEKKIKEVHDKYQFPPCFLPATNNSPLSGEIREGLYFNYVLSQHPDLVKKLRHLKSTNRALPVISFLNKAENLKALSVENCDPLPEEEDIKLHKTSLRYLSIQAETLSAKLLSTLLNSSPELHTLCIYLAGLYENEFTLYEKSLANLKKLVLGSGVGITTQNLKDLLQAAHNINELELSRIYITDEDESFQMPSRPYLTKIDIRNKTFSFEMLSRLIDAAPNLEDLSISEINNNLFDPSLLTIKNKLNKLKNLEITTSTFDAEQLFSLLQSAPFLNKLTFHSCIINNELNLQANSLPFLTEFDGTYTYFTCEQLKNIWDAAPNLSKITIHKPDNFFEFLKSLPSDFLPSLTFIDFPSSRLTSAELTQLIRIAPNLQRIVFIAPTNDKELNTLNLFRQSYPHISIDWVAWLAHAEQSNTYNSPSSFQSLDGKIGKEEGVPTLPARTLFKTKGATQPPVSSYHLHSLSWNSSYGIFTPIYPKSINLESVDESLNLTNQQLEKAFETQEATSKQVYGQINFLKPAINQWMQLPALSTRDELVHYAVEHPDYELKRDKSSGYYFIKFHQPIKSCIVNYLLKPGSDQDEVLCEKIAKEHLEWIAQLSFAPQGNLIDSESYHNLLQLDVSSRIRVLASFCQFQKTSAPEDLSGDTVDILNGLLQVQAGVCRHRAQLFVALASELGIDASLIDNDVHQFVRVHYHEATFTIDLGGGEADVLELPMPAVTTNGVQQPKKQVKAKKQVLPLSTNNRFQTWNSVPIATNNPEDLVTLLTAKDAFARRWLIFKERKEIETLHHLSLAAQNTFFSRDLDSLRLQNLRIDQGKEQWVDSPVSLFLKEAVLNPKQSYTWFVDWSDPKARHVGLNSIIDNDRRNLHGLDIPPNVHIVVVSNQSSAYKMGDDFYSRFDAISQAPELPLLNWPEVKLNQPIQEHDVLFPYSLGWESTLIGRPIFDDGVLGIVPGALMNAAQKEICKLTLHNAPLDDPKFRFFINELLVKKRFFFNGEWQKVPNGFHIDFAMPDLSVYPAIQPPKAEPEQVRVLNQATLTLFFKQYKITNKQTLKPLPGFFASHHSLELVVTDNLSEIQWYSLLKEAQEHQCALTIKATPKVFVPEPLREKVMPIVALESSNLLILSTDKDDEEERRKKKGALTINVDTKTSFNSLFYHVDLKNRKFTGQETQLLAAIRSARPIILKGQFSPLLAQQLQSLFINPPFLWINGEPVSVSNMTIITDDATPFKAISPIAHVYKPEDDFRRLEKQLAQRLQQTYQELKWAPCHSHFLDLPEDEAQQESWVNCLIKRLQWGSGALPNKAEPTTPQELFDYLEQKNMAFLISKTGAGKSHFVQKTLFNYGKSINRPIKIYYELTSLKAFLAHQETSQPILFLDEANLSNEHYLLLEAIVRGDKEFWFEGECYPLRGHKIIFAGNPTHYEGRFAPDLLKRFPNYFPFQGESIEKIIGPLLSHYEQSKQLMALIKHYYTKAQEAGLNISSRNAQMSCLRFLILKESPQTKMMQDDFLMRYALLSEIKTLALDQKRSQELRKDIKQITGWKGNKKQIKAMALQSLPQTENKLYVWTSSRVSAVFTIDILMKLREKKIKGELAQELGINGMLLESDPGHGKSQLIFSLLRAKSIDYVVIKATEPKDLEAQLLDAFHHGLVAFCDEFNTKVNEKLMNALLSGYDLDGNPPKVSGFCLLGAQNPHHKFMDRTPLSDALDNRLILQELVHYSVQELQQILVERFHLEPSEALVLSEEYTSARDYAEQLGLFPAPNPRNLINTVEGELNRKGSLVMGKA